MHIVGTAGHVDHGKSALVISLTGHNPDRFIEERERGMTLDLGFAPLRFEDGVEAGIVDVPGHERFLHNMLAGAAGMELLLLVIAATEGPRPQTREHLHILNFLNVQRAIIVLTKADLVGAEELEIASALALEACEGTVAENAPVIAVSNATGFGIDTLKDAIHGALAALPPRSPDAPPYLPIDRVFALVGHGTIVTGTLMQGTIRTGDSLVLQPSGLHARVRSLQVFGRKVDAAQGGARVAVNLPGIDVASIARGETLVAPREFEPATELQIEFTPLPSALGLLKRRTFVRAHVGSAEIPGQIRFDGKPPGTSVATPARLVLTKPAVAYPGSRLVLRRMSPKDLLGGAVARAMGAASADSVAELSGDAPPAATAVLGILETAGLSPLPATRIAAAANLVVDVAQSALDHLVEVGRAAVVPKPLEYLAKTAFEAAWTKIATALRARHEQKPWQLGCSTAELTATLGSKEGLALRLLSAWHDDGRIAQRGRFWQLPDFTPALTKEQRSYLESALEGEAGQALVPQSFAALSKGAAPQKIEGLADALESLLATGALVRIGDDLYRRSQIERAQAVLVKTLAQSGAATMAQLRDAFGTSRKYALPLMEYFDALGVTTRDGDLRRLRKKTRD